MTGFENVRNCVKCKRLFSDTLGKRVCPSCSKELDDILAEIKKYIRENNCVRMNEVANEFKLPMAQIQQWVREGELELSKDSDIKMFCKNCDKQIFTGMYCDVCKGKMVESMNSLYAPKSVFMNDIYKGDNKNKMRYLDHRE